MDIKANFTKIIGAIVLSTLLGLAISGNAQPGLSNEPDLVVQEVRVSPESPTPGESATITVVVANEGGVDANGPFDVDFHISFGPQELAEIGLGFLVGIRIEKKIVTGVVRRGQTREVQFSWEVLQLPQFKFQFFVDSPVSRIFESGENNNSFETIFEIDEALPTQG